MILLIDNYDSFVHNLARYIQQLGYISKVYRNDQLTVQDVYALNPIALIFSPGPCTPNEAGISLDLVRKFKESLPMLGICLGHQTIAQAFGGEIIKSKQPIHGKATDIYHIGQGLFEALPNPLSVGRYHSLVVSQVKFPNELIVTSYSKEQEIMSFQHVKYPIYGLQFHPESVLTEYGYFLLKRFFMLSNTKYDEIRDEKKFRIYE